MRETGPELCRISVRLPQTQFITDNPPKPFREKIQAALHDIDNDAEFDVLFSSGSGQAQIGCAPCLWGETADTRQRVGATFARSIGAYCLPLAGPLLDRMVLNRSYAGYHGALTLLEDICSLVLGDYQR